MCVRMDPRIHHRDFFKYVSCISYVAISSVADSKVQNNHVNTEWRFVKEKKYYWFMDMILYLKDWDKFVLVRSAANCIMLRIDIADGFH